MLATEFFYQGEQEHKNFGKSNYQVDKPYWSCGKIEVEYENYGEFELKNDSNSDQSYSQNKQDEQDYENIVKMTRMIALLIVIIKNMRTMVMITKMNKNI